jgi:hypothetical protein
MAIQSSYTTVAEQVINFNNNVVSLLSNINTLVTSSEPAITVSITDQSGIARQFTLPSFGFLKSEIDRLNNNINSIYSINDAGALIQPSNGTRFRKVVTVDLNREPNDVSSLNLVTTFVQRKNWFFDGLMNPQLFIELDLSNKVENNVRKILCRRYIPDFAKNADGNLTPLGQSAVNSFNLSFRGRNDFTLEEYLEWHRNTPGIINPNNPNYDEQMFDLEPNKLEYDGLFTVLRVEEDTVNRKLFYHVDTLTYVRNYIDNLGVERREVKQLSTGDEVIINTPVSSTRYKIIEISTIASNPRLRFERVEGNDPIPVGVGTLKIYSPVLYDKVVMVSVGYNERNAVFIKALNMDNYILSKNWSTGLGYYTNDLSEIQSGISMDQFYADTVLDYGQVLADLVVKKTPNTLAAIPNTVNLVVDNFKVVQVNRHLTDTPDSDLLKTKHNQQKNLKSEVNQLLNAISEKSKQLKVRRFSSSADRKQFANELDYLNKQKESKSRLLSSITNEILDLSRSPNIKADPIFRVRGFWSFPEAIRNRGTRPQEVVQFRVQYKYLSKDGRESPIETTKLTDTDTVTNGAISNWVEYKTEVRKREFYASTGTYEWLAEDVSNPDEPNINSLDIPIRYGERVLVRIKSISEVGWPESPVESDWSDELTIEFPDNLNNVVNDNEFILREATKEDLRTTITNDLNARGLDEHLSGQLAVNNVTYHHSSDRILSGFRDDNGVAIDLFRYLRLLEDRIKSLEEKIKRAKGVLEIIVYRDSQEFIVKNGSELVFNIVAEDYLEDYEAPGVASGRVYQNILYGIKEFLLKIRNKSVESPLGLLSNRTYSNVLSDVYNPIAPQVFWVNQQGELIMDNTTGVSKTQKDYQFIWAVNYDSVGNNSFETFTRLSENIGNNFATVGNNSITSILASDEFNVGFSETVPSAQSSILSFVGNNNSITEVSKWIDIAPSAASSRKFMVTVHPEVPSLDKVQETNSDKIKTLEGGQVNDIDIPLNIYFKMNALDPSVQTRNFNYIDFNNMLTKTTRVRKLKFLIENEADNRPFVFTIKFNIQSNWTEKQNKIRDRAGRVLFR